MKFRICVSVALICLFWAQLARAEQVPVVKTGLTTSYTVVMNSDGFADEPNVRIASCAEVSPDIEEDYVAVGGGCISDDDLVPPLTEFGVSADLQEYQCHWSGAVASATAQAICLRGRPGANRIETRAKQSRVEPSNASR